MGRWLGKALLVALLLGSTALRAHDKTVRLSSLEWPPYAGADLPAQGASAAVAKAAFAAMGYRLEIDFLPWSRAILLARHAGSGYAGYFPEYYSASLAPEFVLSAPIGQSPLGFAEHRQAPKIWTTLADLQHTPIGTVHNYINTDEFDQRVAAGQLQVEVAEDDLSNLRKLSQKQIPLIVIDRHVMNYLLARTPELAGDAESLQFNARLLALRQLYICFRNDAQGQALAKIFNSGLAKIDVQAILSQHLSVRKAQDKNANKAPVPPKAHRARPAKSS